MLRVNKLAVLAAALLAIAFATGTALAIPIPNGSFELGNVDFTSAYAYFPVPASPASSYSTPKASLYDEGTYGVGTDPGAYHISWTHFGDHTTGRGNMMIVNGATDAGVVLWGVPTTGTLSVVSGQTYYFGAWLASVYPQFGAAPIAPATLAFSINGVQIGPDFTLTAPVGTWQLFFRPWVADSNQATLSLINKNTIASGNDFALDDITFDTRPPNAVPEPSTALLLGAGLMGLAVYGRKRVSKR